MGTLALSPGGGTALVSLGGDLFLLDAQTGAIRETRSVGPDALVLDAAYGWNGQRIVAAEAPLGMYGTTCGTPPYDGTVTLLDPATLSPIATVADWKQWPRFTLTARRELPWPPERICFSPRLRTASRASGRSG